MKKIVLFFLFLASLLYGYNYDEVVLKAQASIFPKIVLLDKKLNEKLIDGQIYYTIIYEQSDYLTALEIKEYIQKKYPDTLDGYRYKINLVEFSQLSPDINTSVFHVLNSDKYISKAADIAKQAGIISFAYDVKNLHYGLMLSLLMEKSTVLYLNKNNLNMQDVEFVNVFLQMVKFIYEDDS